MLLKDKSYRHEERRGGRGKGEERKRRRSMREKGQETCANLQICCPLMAADRWGDDPTSNAGAVVI